MEALKSVVDSIGGPVVAILLLLSIAATSIILFKIWQRLSLGRKTASQIEQAQEMLKRGEYKKALLLTRNQRHPRLQIFAATLNLSQHGDVRQPAIQQEIRRIARQALLPLFQGLRPLEVIANIAPLLGLFGTVLGMIEAFRAMEAAGAQVDPSVLSGGIWQALLTTAYGLAVAIPVSLIQSVFERQTEAEVTASQDLLEQLLFHFDSHDNHHSESQIS